MNFQSLLLCNVMKNEEYVNQLKYNIYFLVDHLNKNLQIHMDVELYLDLFYMLAFVKEVNLDFLFLFLLLFHFGYFELGSIFFFFGLFYLYFYLRKWEIWICLWTKWSTHLGFKK